jgi:uncharacterized protein (DUF1501 family)
VAMGAAVPGVFGRAVAAGMLDGVTAPSVAGRKLILVQLAGGNDGLNTVIPYADDAYRAARPNIGVTGESVVRLDERFGLHPNLAALQGLWQAGHLAIVQGVGYPDPNLSHFTSMHVWQTASPDGKEIGGWLGRYLDALEAQQHDPFMGFNVGTRVSPELTTGATPLLSLASVDQYQPRFTGGDAPQRQQALLKLYESYPATAPYAALLETSADDAMQTSQQLQTLSAAYQPAVDYPQTSFASGLQLLASVIASDQPLRVGHVTLGGFDTHAKEDPTHEQLMQTLAEGLSAFFADLEAHGAADDVLVMTWSEFGRRVGENASGGTDHGTAAPLFVLGSGVKGGLYGDAVSLTQLDDNRNLRFTTDFRSVYSTVIEGWMQTDPAPVLGDAFPSLGFV